MVIGYEVENLSHRAEQNFSIVNIDYEFALQRVVHVDAGPDVGSPVIMLPVRFESKWNAFPTLRVDSKLTCFYSLNRAPTHFAMRFRSTCGSCCKW